MTTDRKEELEKVIREARDEIIQMEDAEREKRNRALVGKCFKCRDSYSCPEKSTDYWWLYVKVVGLAEGGELKVWTFVKDKYGKWEIVFDSIRGGTFDTYTPIPPSEFLFQWTKAIKEIAKSAQARLGGGKKG